MSSWYGVVRATGLALLVFVLAGCSAFQQDDDDAVEASPLPAMPETPVRLDRSWSRGIGNQGDEALQLALTPVVDGGSLYAANADGKVFAIDRSDGRVRWTASVEQPVLSAVGAGAGRVFVCVQDGRLHALDAASGERLWEARASSEVLASPVTDGDVVLVQAIDNRVQAFDAATGQMRWDYSAAQPVLGLRGNSAPGLREGMAYLAFDNGKVAAVDAGTGMMRWEQRVMVPEGRSELERVIDVQADPLVTYADVLVGSYQGAVTSLGREDGRPQWQEKASVKRSMASGDGSVFVVEANDHVRALRLSSGREAWRFDGLAGRKLSSPAVIGEYVAVADADGYIHLLSQSEGGYVGRYRVGGDGVRANLLGDGDVIYVLTASGRLHALSLKP